METNIYKITIGEEQGTGFFCKMPFPNKDNMMSVFITCNHIINENILNNKKQKIKINIKNENESRYIVLDVREWFILIKNMI